MKHILICCFFILNTVVAQETTRANELIDTVYTQLIKHEGSMINFEYLFENEAHKMQKPISGKLGLFSNNRFYLEFNPSNQNKVIQIYNGDVLFTIIPEEKEIQIDNIDPEESIFIQDIFNNYQTDFNTNIQEDKTTQTIIELTPKRIYNETIFNNCIDQLSLPTCLKLPNQCKIGMMKKDKMALEICLEENYGYIENDILKVELIIDSKNLTLESITQFNRYNGKTSIQIKSIQKGSTKILNISESSYKDFEKIDLR